MECTKKNVMHVLMHVHCLRSRCCRLGGSLSPYWHVWSKPSKLTNYRVYQELVYRNDVLKIMLTGSTYPSLPSSPAVFAQLFSMRFHYYLGAWNRLAHGSWILCLYHVFAQKQCILCSALYHKSYLTVLNVPSIRDPFSLGIFVQLPLY